MKELANPFSTGNGGANFEIKVQASFLVAMLTNGSVPCFPMAKVNKIKLQGKRDGFETDDCVVFLTDLTGGPKKLLAQIKHQISFTKSNALLGEVLSSAWSDFQNSSMFDKTKDKLALITGPLSKDDTNSVRPILDWAKFSESASDFLERVKTKNYSSNEKRTKLDVIKFHLEKAKGSGLSNEELWLFCKQWNVLGYDLDSTSSVLSANILSLISSAKGTNTEKSENIWNQINVFVSSANQNAGVISRETIDSQINEHFLAQDLYDDDITRLREHATPILKRVNNRIGDFHLRRQDLVNELVKKVEEVQFVLVSGVAGSGKSALALDVVNNFKDDIVFYLRTEDLNYSHIDAAFTAIGIRQRLTKLTEKFSLISRKFLIIESVEKVLELDHTEAFVDLLKMLEDDPGWKIIATCRSYSVSHLTSFCFVPAKIFPGHIDVSILDDEELSEVVEHLPSLKNLIKNSNMHDFLKNPFFLNISHKVAGSLGNEISLSKLKDTVWTDVIGKAIERKNGLPLRRIESFIEISIRRARQMQLAVNIEGIDSEAILNLERDGLLTAFDGSMFAPSHDLLEDWAIERFINNQFAQFESTPSKFFDSVGSSLAFRRTFRHWFQSLMLETQKETNLRTFVLNALAANIPEHWKDELITCILLSQSATTYLNDLSGDLLKNDLKLLRRFCFILRIACKGPDHETMRSLGLKVDTSSLLLSRFLKPTGPGWIAVIDVILKNKNRLDEKFVPYVAPLLKDWSSLVRTNSENVTELRKAGLVALHFLHYVKDSYRDEHLNDFIEVIIKTYPGIKKELDSILEQDLFQETKRPARYIERFCEEILTTFMGSFLCTFNPELVIKIAWKTWKVERDLDDDNNNPLDISAYFGIDERHTRTNFTNPSAFKGPFWSLLKVNFKLGLDFIIGFTDYAAEKYSRSNLDEREVTQIELTFSESEKNSQIFSSRLWNAYIGTSVMPGVVNCALMALEKCLIEKAESGNSIENDVEYILRNSKSVLTTSIVAGIAPGFWNKMEKSIFPILRCRELFASDMARMISSRSNGGIDWFGLELHDPSAEIYRNERKKANSYKWRTSHLEDVVRHLLFSNQKDEVEKLLDNYYAQLPPEQTQTIPDKLWRIALSRMDLRKYSITEDKENKQVVFTAPTPPEDIRKMQEESRQELTYQGRFMALNQWGTQKYNGELLEDKYFLSWKEGLKEAKWAYEELLKNKGDVTALFSGGIFYSTAYCVREHIDKIDPNDLNWIIDLYVDLIDKTASAWFARDFSESGTNGFHSVAYCLAKLYSFAGIQKKKKESLKKAIISAIIHPSSRIQTGAANGIRDNLWSSDPVLAESCFAGSLAAAKAHVSLYPYYHFSDEKSRQENYKKVRSTFEGIRAKVLSGKIEYSFSDFSFKSHSSWDLKSTMLIIPISVPSQNCISLLKALLKQFLILERNQDQDRHDRIDYKAEILFKERLGKVILANGLEHCEREFGELLIDLPLSPKFSSGLVKEITYGGIDNFTNGDAWKIWSYFGRLVAPSLVSESKKSWETIKWSKLDKVPRALLFNGAEWKGKEFEVLLIGSGKESILAFFRECGSHPDVFESFLKLCYHFSGLFLPDSLPTICNFVIGDDQRKLFKPVNSKYYLEQVVMRFVIGNFRSLRGNPSLTKNLLLVLDYLVDDGSSVAYFLRERVVTLI